MSVYIGFVQVSLKTFIKTIAGCKSMVLESIIGPAKAEQRPWDLVLIGFIYTTIALFLSLWVFQEHASLVMIFLSAMACIPLLYKTIAFEEQKHLTALTERSLLFEHSKAFVFLMALFIGATISFSLWYLVLPQETTQTLYSAQASTIISLNQKVTGNVAQLNIMTKIFLNNVKVMIFCIIFSFLYGSGAIFILMWNASVIGVAFGNFFRVKLAEFAASVGLTQVSSYFYVIGYSVLRYAIHGVPEILAYVIAGLAGGIISVAVIRHDFGTKNFERIILDASDLILLAVFILFIAAGVEVYITPAVVS